MAHLLNVEAYASYIGVTYGNLSEDRKVELNGQRLLELKLQGSHVSVGNTSCAADKPISFMSQHQTQQYFSAYPTDSDSCLYFLFWPFRYAPLATKSS